VLVKDQYAIVASLLQGLVVVDLAKVIGESLKELALAAGGGTFDPGTTLPVAGPIGMTYQEDAANAICEPGEPKAVVGTWNANGLLKWPMSLKPYGANALVSDPQAGVYRVDLTTLPGLDGTQVYAGPAFRADGLVGVKLTDPTTGEQRQTDVVAITAQDGITLVDVGTGAILSTADVPEGVAYDVRANVDKWRLTVGTSGSGLRFYDFQNPYDLRFVGTTAADLVTGGVALASNAPIVLTAKTSDGANATLTDQKPIEITLYDALDFGPKYVAPATLSFAQEWTSVPPGAKAMRGAQADGASLLVIRAKLPDKSKATEVEFSLLSMEPGPGSDSTAIAGGLFAEWPTAADIRDSKGSLTVTAEVKVVEGKRIAAVIYRAPTEFAPRLDYFERFRDVLVFAETKKPEEKPIDKSERILVRRPPLVLIHGYRSGPKTWNDLKRVTRNLGPFPQFDLNTEVSYVQINTEGLDRIYRPIPGVLNELQKKARGGDPRIAATRFSVLAHSMGGLATWMFVSEIGGTSGGVTIQRDTVRDPPGDEHGLILFESRKISRKAGSGAPEDLYYFRRSSNYGAGSINRIITVGTPYSGSPVAGQALQIIASPTPLQTIARTELLSRPLGGNGDRSAYADFSEKSKSSPGWALNRLWISDPSGVPVHALVAVAQSDQQSAVCQEWLIKPGTVGMLEPAPRPSDMIVPADSQRGGLALAATVDQPGPAHILPTLMCHTQETSSLDLIWMLPRLLNNPNGSDWFYARGLPAR
jgi:triacylglycerol esterase/lipase EstA (alpha/beta hydrolase family)